ncbi:uncharacterized protein [Musca autumnalis]|uniref:uncharacterized protein n=1 Tax=Musca autumnalis TaxID=221902 RepID=UPI003CEDD989
MVKDKLFVKFQKLANMFLEFEKEYNSIPQDEHTMFSVELRKEEFGKLWKKEAVRLFKQCREAYICCAAQMGELSQSFLNQSSWSSTMVNQNRTQGTESLEAREPGHRLRLPPCTTEIFYGDYLSWPSFRDLFTAVYINCQSITPVEKLFYLRQSTQGEALEIVKKSPLTNDGFQTAWSNLKDRYENKRILVNSQLKILFNLQNVKSESAAEIKRLQRDINNCITALELHEINIDNWDPIFVFLCSIKLPTETLSLWEQTVSNKTEISKWSELDDFLTARFHSLETVFDLTQSQANSSIGRNVSHNAMRMNKRVKSYQTNIKKYPCFVLLGTAIVNIKVNGVIFTARALIDSGSQATFISERLRRRLNLPVKPINARISGLNEALAGSSEKQCTLNLRSPHNIDFEVRVSSLVLPQLTGKLPAHTIDLPDSFSLDGVRKDILGSLVAQETVFGWVLTGPIASPGTFTTVVSFCTAVEVYKLIEKFWKLEEPPNVLKYSPEEEFCEEVYKKTTRRLEDGRYVVSLPFKPQFLNGKGLGSSRIKASRQFMRNETSLCKKQDFKLIYDEVLEEYKNLGHMVPVDTPNDETGTFYLPHHAVIKPESSSTKVRVVFNASSKTSTGISLNDALYPGPVLQNDLRMLIIRWRFYRFVFNGDIEKMYRQIWLEKEHTKYQRIVFRKDPKADLEDFELKTVTFGVNCAPFLAIRTLLQLASDVETDLPLAAKILRSMMYVDNALAGAHDVELAIEAREQLIEALSSAGFSMRKWTSTTS